MSNGRPHRDRYNNGQPGRPPHRNGYPPGPPYNQNNCGVEPALYPQYQLHYHRYEQHISATPAGPHYNQPPPPQEIEDRNHALISYSAPAAPGPTLLAITQSAAKESEASPPREQPYTLSSQGTASQLFDLTLSPAVHGVKEAIATTERENEKLKQQVDELSKKNESLKALIDQGDTQKQSLIAQHGVAITNLEKQIKLTKSSAHNWRLKCTEFEDKANKLGKANFEKEKVLKDLEKQVATLSDELNATKNTVQNLKISVNDLQKKLDASEEANNASSKQVLALKSSEAEIRAKYEKKFAEYDNLKAKKVAQDAELKRKSEIIEQQQQTLNANEISLNNKQLTNQSLTTSINNLEASNHELEAKVKEKEAINSQLTTKNENLERAKNQSEQLLKQKDEEIKRLLQENDHLKTETTKLTEELKSSEEKLQIVVKDYYASYRKPTLLNDMMREYIKKEENESATEEVSTTSRPSASESSSRLSPKKRKLDQVDVTPKKPAIDLSPRDPRLRATLPGKHSISHVR